MVAAKQPGATTATNQDISMRKFQPSLVDWDEIAARLMAGEPTARVAQDYEISRQAIAKRAKREGWLDSQAVMQSARKNADVGVSAGKMVDRSFRVEIEREDCFGWSEKFSRGGEIDRFVAYRRLERASVFTFG